MPRVTVRGNFFVWTIVVLLAACASAPSKETSTTSPNSQATPSAAPTAKKHPAWMNDRGEVTDSAQVESGYGQMVKGLNDWQGEITGVPGPGSRFAQLQIGMGMKQVIDIAGPPTDRGAYITAKRFIPFYFGSDKRRYELAYKGLGRLIFASPGGFERGQGNLIWIIHNPTDSGYR